MIVIAIMDIMALEPYIIVNNYHTLVELDLHTVTGTPMEDDNEDHGGTQLYNDAYAQHLMHHHCKFKYYQHYRYFLFSIFSPSTISLFILQTYLACLNSWINQVDDSTMDMNLLGRKFMLMERLNMQRLDRYSNRFWPSSYPKRWFVHCLAQ